MNPPLLQDSIQSRKVSFALHQTEYFTRAAAHPITTKEEYLEEVIPKDELWYSHEDLLPTRIESRQTLQALQEANGECHKVPQHLCLRGIEKYGKNLSAKIQSERVLKETVLKQQFQATATPTDDDDDDVDDKDSNDARKRTCPEQLATLSRYLSEPSRQIAYQWAQVNAQDVFEESYLSNNNNNNHQGPQVVSHGFRVPGTASPTTIITTTTTGIGALDPSTPPSSSPGVSKPLDTRTSLLIVTPSSPKRILDPSSSDENNRITKKARCALSMHDAPRHLVLRTTE